MPQGAPDHVLDRERLFHAVSPEMCALALETGKRHVGRIVEEVKRRPLYVVSRTLGESWPGGARVDGPGKA